MGLSRLYSAKIDRIPLISHTPPPLPGVEDDFENMTSVGIKSNGQDHAQQRRFNAGAEDAAFELERTVLQDYQKSKTDDNNRKRPVPGPGSDLESDMDISKTADGISAPAIKKRKLENDDIEESISLKFSSKNKGKGKQAQRETSPDSVSLTSKLTRKKPGPKKRVGLALELDNERPSQPSSLMGDVTPVVSRPTSPALTHTTMVYELDEQIPPMKKAKKVDDNAMIKRIKSLEEAQRKVWTNIARRDVAKVILSLGIYIS